MPRGPLQDMVKTKPIKGAVIKKIPRAGVNPEPFAEFAKNNPPKKSSKKGIYLVALASVIFLLFSLSYFFSLARVTIIPKIREIPLNGNFSAVKDSRADGISFELVAIPGEEHKSIIGGAEKDVAVKATGAVIIYNSYSSASQNLDIDTRLEGSNGKMYKTVKKISVPGIKKDGKPGSVEVGIYAAVAGEEYNSTPLDFKIFGFKGTPKYSKFYARSKSDITGGFKGKSAMLSLLDKTTVISDLKATLEERLLEQATKETPAGFILFQDGVFLDIKDADISFVPESEGKVSATAKGTLYGLLFNEKKLAREIGRSIIDDYNDSEIYITNIKTLAFSLVNKSNISFADAKNVEFALSGKPEIVWRVDEEKFVNDLLKKKKGDFIGILAQFVSIDSAELTLRPFWKRYFPEDSRKIEIVVKYPVY